MFKGRKLVIATKHRKEIVIGPLIEAALQVVCFVPQDFDTDLLGTFTGDIERTQDPIETVRHKCLMAMDASNCDIGIASEGSFGPHPSVFFASADDEFLIFIDRKNNLEIIARELSLETNFNGQEIRTEKELLDFALAAHFPSHGLILRTSKNDVQNVIKGITSMTQLVEAFHNMMQQSNSIYIETDMRAMHNPSRMTVIENLTKKLVEKINSSCPQCQVPGYAVTDVKKGLECGLCRSATSSVLSHIYTCQHCAFSEEKMYPDNKTSEDPTYCDYCNP